MRLVKFRISNYKSIQDTGYCWLASDLSVLAGKNESGKTAILEALRDFDSRNAVGDAAKPIDRPDDEPLIECHFELTDEEVDVLLEPDSDAMRDALCARLKASGLTLIKDARSQYRFDDEVATVITQIDAEETERALKAEEERAEAARRAAEEAARAEAEAEAQEPGEGDQEEDQEEDGEEPEGEEVEAEDGEDEAAEAPSDQPAPLLERAIARVPRFIFFSSFEDVLPFEITFTKAQSSPSVQDFATVAGLDLELVRKMADTQARMNYLSARSAQIAGDFKSTWRQDEITLVATSEGQNLIIGVQEEGRTHRFKVEQRSKGLQWFLSFYLRLNAEKSAERIILIDEPGLYLHARAQTDVLDVLEKMATQGPIIFSTHSPYLLDPNRFDRIRLIIKDAAAGTTIQGKVHAGADAETLTPIVTAAGLDVARQFSVAGRKNVLLEGITDYFYLQAFRSLVKRKGNDELSFTPAVGAQNIPNLASLLIGWGLQFVALLDADTEGKRVAKTLREKLSVPEARILSPGQSEGESIEDVLTREDFDKYVLGDESRPDEALNSTAMKAGGFDSVLLALKFAQKAREESQKVKLSEESRKRITDLFKRLRTAFDQDE